MMLSREFKRSEKIVLLVLAVILLILVYYRFVYRWVDDRIRAADTIEIETEMMREQAKALEIKEMQAAIGNPAQDTGGYVPSYNNFKEEADALNEIMKKSSSFSFEYMQPEADGDAVRREIAVSFTATSYRTARRILREIHDCPSRCLIRDLRITALDSGGEETAHLRNAGVSCTLSVVFFETLYDADTTDGLDIQ